MEVSRIVTYVESPDLDAARAFYAGLLGMTEWDPGADGFAGLAASANPSAQIVLVRPGIESPQPRFAVDVGTPDAVDAVHADAVARGLRVVYPPTDEPWGIRRFFVEDPAGTVVSIAAHRP